MFLRFWMTPDWAPYNPPSPWLPFLDWISDPADLVAFILVLMVSWRIFWLTPMNYFFRTVLREQNIGLLSGKTRLSIDQPGGFSLRSWKARLLSYCLGSKKAKGSWWKGLRLLWILGWLLAALWIFWFVHLQGVEKRRELLTNMCDERARMLQDQFNVSMNHVQALAILISAFHHSKIPSSIDQRTFARYTEQTAFERPLTSGVAYAVKVLHSERKQFERQQGWTIKRMDDQERNYDSSSDNTQETSPIEEEYAPVIFAQDTISHVISLDMLSGKEDRENILRARESGKGVLSAPLRLLKSNRLGVILTFAVYKSELPSNSTPSERIQGAIGYIGGVFDIESLVEKLLLQLASKQAITVNVYDTTNHIYRISMFGSNESSTGMFHISNLHFGDPLRMHEMHCRFMENAPLPWLAMTTSIGSLVIALLIGHIFSATVNRIAKVEDDYRQMMELKKRAEAADIAKSQFLATVSHEIRTPMNGVLGMLQMLMDTELDVTQQDYVRTAQGSGKALVSLINEVLDQAKIESGKLELEAVQFDLRALLDDILSLFYGKSQEKGVELAAYVSDEVPESLIGDPGRIRQIITNLMGNSIKFTEKGHVFVTVHLVEEATRSICADQTEFSSTHTLSGYPVVDRQRSWESFKIRSRDLSESSDEISLIISVEDTGLGIPRESQPHIFTPFMQVGPSISRIQGGTGIGLSISKCLVGLMKGEIRFASELDVGSTFTFTAVLKRGPVRSEVFRTLKFQGMRALVVDDRRIRASITKYYLERLGVQVDMAPSFYYSISQMSNSVSVFNMVLVEKEVWARDPNSCVLFNNVLKNGNKSTVPKLFLLESPASAVKMNSTFSSEEIPPTILKPLRASMLAVAIQKAMGVETDGGGSQSSSGSRVVSLSCLLRGKQILVVDDNPVNLRVAAGALKKYGADVTCTDSGKKAIAMLKPPHSFHACFMDVQMPKIDGLEATRTIRALEEDINHRTNQGNFVSLEVYGNMLHWHVPILAMTADVIQATQEACLKSGMDGYVSKPFEGEQLYREVARFFKSSKEN